QFQFGYLRLEMRVIVRQWNDDLSVGGEYNQSQSMSAALSNGIGEAEQRLTAALEAVWRSIGGSHASTHVQQDDDVAAGNHFRLSVTAPMRGSRSRDQERECGGYHERRQPAKTGPRRHQAKKGPRRTDSFE